MGIILIPESEDDNTLSIVSRVNIEGSGIYIENDINPDDLLTIASDGTVTYKADGWKGLVFGTPGSSTIQHIQLMTIVQEELGLQFIKYEGSTSNNAVYYVDSITNAVLAIDSDLINGGIIWEPQYHKAIENSKYIGLATTNQLFPGHTCCVIAGMDSFMGTHEQVTIRFLAAYVDAMDWINAALADPTGEDYQRLIEIVKKYTQGLDDTVIKESLDTVTYAYSDQVGTADLSKLESDVASLVDNLYALGKLSNTLSSLGFSDSTDFADAFVDNSYLQQAIDYDSADSGSMFTVSVAAIAGDIHQIGLQVAFEQGIFETYGIDVNIKYLANGAAVSLDLLSGESDFGFVGAPPLTTNSINTGAVKND